MAAIAITVGSIVFTLKGGHYVTIQNKAREYFKKFAIESDVIKEPIIFTPPICAMIENEISSRPFQLGLKEADIVYEAPTEGGITRFLAIFPPKKKSINPFDENPAKIGPLRSSRPYFVDLVHEYNCVYVHVGGSPEAMSRLRKEKIFDADQYFNDKYYSRENEGRVALEHTMFSSGPKIQELINEKGWIWEPTDNLPETAREFGTTTETNFNTLPQAVKISVDFGFYSYRVSYEYDAATGLYMRSQAKRPHIDNSDQQQISARTIVVQTVKAWPLNDDKDRIAMKTIGEGKAVVFTKGRAIKATWKKEALESPTRFFDEAGAEISITDKPAWIEILPSYNSFSYE